MTRIPAIFIGSFRTGDNIIYNLDFLTLLYGYFSKESKRNQLVLVKPIVTTIASIIEAILFDFRARVRGHTKEKSVNLALEVLEIFQTKPNDKFQFYIEQARKHKFFDSETKTICKRLDALRELRNRVHIQNKENYKPLLESDAFTIEAKGEAEYLIKYIMIYMHNNHPRPSHARLKSDFVLPF